MTRRTVLHVPLFIFLTTSTLLASCRSGTSADSADRPTTPAAGPDAPSPIPWPPPGAVKGAPPAEVVALFGRMADALGRGDSQLVKQLFVSDQTFSAVSECDSQQTLADLAGGRAEAGKRAERREPTKIIGITEGYLLEVPAGGKPGPCKARRPLTLYFGRYELGVASRTEAGEAHFMRVGDVWYFAKL
ncbi:MAG: hypothetical protein IV100_05210 [Myxococcales bacterium]|nr:hypothetical protein [Myxococcales bacterium]